jgi:hypothetical protein
MTQFVLARFALIAAVATLAAQPLQAASQAMPSQGANRSVNVVKTPSGGEAVIVRDRTMSSGDITSSAGRFEDGARVTVSGTIQDAGDTDFTLTRPDGQVRAVLTDEDGRLLTGYNAQLADEIQPGRTVTVYGRLRRTPGDLTEVETEALYDNATGKFMVTPLGRADFARRASTGRVELHYQPL